MAIGGLFLLALRLSRVGTPTDSSSYLEGANFLTATFSTPLTLWVILFFYFGVLSLRRFPTLAQLGGLWNFVGSRCLRLIGFMQRQFELHVLSVSVLTMQLLFRVLLPYLLVYFSSTLGQSSWFFAPSFGVAAIFRFLLFSRFPQLDTQPLPYDGGCWYTWRSTTVCYPRCNS